MNLFEVITRNSVRPRRYGNTESNQTAAAVMLVNDVYIRQQLTTGELERFDTLVERVREMINLKNPETQQRLWSAIWERRI